mgnify:CR=1 FL=1
MSLHYCKRQLIRSDIDDIVRELPTNYYKLFETPTINLDHYVSIIHPGDIRYLCSKLCAKSVLYFHYLCQDCQTNTIKTLLPYFDVNLLDSFGRNPIFYAVRNHLKSNTKLLAPLSKKVVDIHGFTVLNYAQTPEIVSILIKNGYNVNSEKPENSPLISALKKGTIECAMLLIENGADVNIIRKHTPLMYALKMNHYEDASKLIELLLLKGARIDGIYANVHSRKHEDSVLSIAIGNSFARNLNPYIVRLLSMGYIPNYYDIMNALQHSTFKGFLYVYSCAKPSLLKRMCDSDSELVEDLWCAVVAKFNGFHCPNSRLRFLLCIIGDIRHIKHPNITCIHAHKNFVDKLDPNYPTLFHILYTRLVIEDHRKEILSLLTMGNTTKLRGASK